MFIYKCISPKIVILSFFMVLTSCGGGGDGSTPPPPATDKTPPEIIATNPGSENQGVRLLDLRSNTKIDS